METIICNLTESLKQSHGIDISPYENSFLMKSLKDRRSEKSFLTATDYVDLLKTDDKEAHLFLESLHIGFSEFFRNPLTFAFLEEFILPQMWAEKKRNGENQIRAWSAACASGQEPYSLAILFDEMVEMQKQTPEIRIFATDNNPEALLRAQNGIYHLSSLNKVSFKRIRNYFTPSDDSYEIRPNVKKYVDFSYFDLLSDQRACPTPSIYGNFDLVFCSNMLFYFKAESRKAIIEKISKTMAHGAFLVTGETERDIFLKCNFKEVFVNSAIFKKSV